jgi:predicted acyl esterase
VLLIVAVVLVGIAGCGADTSEIPSPPASVDRVFDRIECIPVDGMRYCEGSIETRVPSFDGVPLDVNVAFPADSIAEAPFPLVVRMHGYNGTKDGPYLGGARGRSTYTTYTDSGFAVMTFTARGRGASCGTEASRRATPEACTRGWDHLGDARHSIRDVQYLSGRLVDAGLVEPAIGVQGGSYGGGRGLLLATLRDRIQEPDGSYAPWTSPEHGIAMQIGAAVPFIAWSDLTYALAPNGRALDYAIGSDTLSRAPLGVLKQSIVQGLWRQGQSHYNAPPNADSSIDLSTWFEAFPSSAPSTETSRHAAREFTQHHAAISLPMDRPPAPTLIANGFTDDIFPVTEALRWVQRVREAYPEATVAQLYGDFGHRRANQTSASLLAPRAMAWFQRHLQDDEGPTPTGVEAFVQSCEGGFGQRHHAETWRELSAGELRLVDSTQATVRSDAENRRVSRLIDPPSGQSPEIPSSSCRRTARSAAPGTASYTFPPVGRNVTLMGSPTIQATVSIRAEENALIVGRLWDIDPEEKTRTLITQGITRPMAAAHGSGGATSFVFQLYPNAYSLAKGHRAELQLLGRSTPYVRPPTDLFQVRIERVDIRLPTAERPSDAPDRAYAADTGRVARISPQAPRILPEGMRWAPGYDPTG